ncbi:MAG TPA: hypothetical protein VM052_00375 [Candidatus Limnocylindrales bacterium]|nr:hypothetical protein [Candidatus Limnocylindrales bacterium]
MRNVLLTASVFVFMATMAAPASAPTFTQVADAAAATHATVPIRSGTGFAVCGAKTTWRRPVEFEANAILYDGRSVDALTAIVSVARLVTASTGDAHAATCWTQQPQVFLFGYEATAYDAQDQKIATLRVRPADGYRAVIITGPVRSQIAVVAEERLDTLAVPDELITPIERYGSGLRGLN